MCTADGSTLSLCDKTLREKNSLPTIRFTVVAELVAPSDPVYVRLASLRLASIDWLRNLPLQRLHEQHVAHQWEQPCVRRLVLTLVRRPQTAAHNHQ